MNGINSFVNNKEFIAGQESNFQVKPGEIHMNEDELGNNRHEDYEIARESHRTGMEEM